jgi:membrane-bound lytic murein transglycosylase D
MAPGPRPSQSKHALLARVLTGPSRDQEQRFADSFVVGRGPACEFRVLDEAVAPAHLQVVYSRSSWWLRDLSGTAGVFVRGERVNFGPLPPDGGVGLWKGGPRLSLTLAGPDGAERDRALAPPSAAPSRAEPTERDLELRFLRPVAPGEKLGRETAFFRQAIARARVRSSRKYQMAIGAAALLLLGAAAVIGYQLKRLRDLRATAEQLFYAAKAVELQTEQLEDLVLAHADPKLVSDLRDRQSKMRGLRDQYDTFVRDLDIYQKRSPRERVMLRVARAFGECEANVPEGFLAEVQRHVDRQLRAGNLGPALRRAKEKGYALAIGRAFGQANLPPQYYFMALQESGFDERAVGPPTRYGHAKGMWQFIAVTANRYGLKVGPLYLEPVYDPQDERFEWRKATAAAARYVRDLHATEAQGSGLLVMACYNWGENKVRDLIATMPENPRERNFWRLLQNPHLPHETYEYVLSIFSAAVICEDPQLFGASVDCPPRFEESNPTAAVR